MSLSLNQFLLHCTDVARSLTFYEGLGLLPIVKSEENGALRYVRFEVPGNRATLSLLAATSSTVGSTEIAFECDDVDAEVSRLETSGYRFDSAPTDQPWLWREAHFRDPDGHQLMLFTSNGNRLNPPWKVK
jgi:predicted enzyme related to lactoylglutathione lyase